MQTILSYNKQLFNVKEIAPAGLTLDQITEGMLAIVDVTTDLTVAPNSFEDLPKKFRMAYLMNGHMRFGFDCIVKDDIVWTEAQEYQAPQQNKWEVVIDHCRCIDSVRLNLFLEDERLNAMQGLTWGDTESYVEVSPQEMECYCSCNEAGTYANNILTLLLYKQILAKNSCLYTASVETEGGEKLDTIEKIEKFIEDNKEVNTDKEEGNDGEKLKLILEGKPYKGFARFNPYNYNAITPVGLKMQPGLSVNGSAKATVKELTKLEFEIGNGMDLVAFEHKNRGYYLREGQFPTHKCDHGFNHVPFEFEESKKYDTVTFEFDNPKQIRAGRADMKRFMVIFGSEVDLNANVHQKLKSIFTKP